MPIYLDRHDLKGITGPGIQEAHERDLAIQDKYGVRFLTYWFDTVRESGFCLIDAPDAETAMRVHDEAHGNVAQEVIEVDMSAVEAFLGRIAHPPVTAPDAASDATPDIDPAFRAVMFTDIVGSTEMTARLGDARAVEMVRAHDGVVREAVRSEQGREVKHTGDGLMISFDDVDAAVRCARSTMRALNDFNASSAEKLIVRIGIHAGEPIEDSNDLFGVTVQMAARICDEANAEAIAVSREVRDSLKQTFALSELGTYDLKGFDDSVSLFEVAWR